jgi:phosphoglycerate dehydrogenase-like enzyme
MTTSKPIKIVTHKVAAPVLDLKVEVPHTVAVLPEGDAEIAQVLADCDVLVWTGYKKSWRAPGATGPRLIHATGAGTEPIDLTALPPGCKVCNVYGHERGVTEQAVMHMFALQKHAFAIDAAMRRGNWMPELPFLTEMRRRNLLVLGLGHIGCEIVRWGEFMEMNVTALTRNPAKVRAGAPRLRVVGGLNDLATHLPEADFVVLALPAGPETVDMIGERELALMKPTAFIVNVARGSLINEKALYEALRTKRIAGAGLEVWYSYPYAGPPYRFPFNELDNVVMGAHKATIETIEYRFPEISKNIDRFARGEPLVNQVWPR